MGLEGHIKIVLANKSPQMKYFYFFEDGKVIFYDQDRAEEAKEILDDSGQFGPTTVVKEGDHWVIEIGKFSLHSSISRV